MQEIISKTVSDCGKTTELSSNDDKLSKMHTHTHTNTHREKSSELFLLLVVRHMVCRLLSAVFLPNDV